MKRRIFDFVLAALGLIALAPALLIVIVLVWSQDWRSPFYIADRAGLGGRSFRMVKIRSMVTNADRSGVQSTSANDNRITKIGHFVRRWKIDELSQLWNVLKGDMSLVGPRPNTLREVDNYTPAERGLLQARPGITDISSIVFSDEGDILANSSDPDADYSKLIWPWKSQMGLLYVKHASVRLNLRLICLTLIAIFDKDRALASLNSVLVDLGASPQLQEVASRQRALQDFAVDGMAEA